MFERLDRDGFAQAKEHEFFEKQKDMSTPTTDGAWNADNITVQAIDLAAFTLKQAAKDAERTWSDSQYGLLSPSQAAVKMNEIFNRIAIISKP